MCSPNGRTSLSRAAGLCGRSGRVTLALNAWYGVWRTGLATVSGCAARTCPAVQILCFHAYERLSLCMDAFGTAMIVARGSGSLPRIAAIGKRKLHGHVHAMKLPKLH